MILKQLSDKTSILKKAILLQCFTVLFFASHAQYGTLADVKNVKFELIEDKVIITYDLLYAKPNDTFDIIVDIYNSASYKIDAQTIEGEFANVKRGRNKKIIWYIGEDFTNFEDNIFVIVTAKHKNYKDINRVTRIDAIWKSSLWPGWGSAQTRFKKENYVKGVIAYGLLTSTAFLYKGFKNKNHLAGNESDEDRRQNLSTEAEILLITSYVTLGGAALIWIWDYSEILFNPNLSKKIKFDFEAYNINNKLVPMLSFKMPIK